MLRLRASCSSQCAHASLGLEGGKGGFICEGVATGCDTLLLRWEGAGRVGTGSLRSPLGRGGPVRVSPHRHHSGEKCADS